MSDFLLIKKCNLVFSIQFVEKMRLKLVRFYLILNVVIFGNFLCVWGLRIIVNILKGYNYVFLGYFI